MPSPTPLSAPLVSAPAHLAAQVGAVLRVLQTSPPSPQVLSSHSSNDTAVQQQQQQQRRQQQHQQHISPTTTTTTTVTTATDVSAAVAILATNLTELEALRQAQRDQLEGLSISIGRAREDIRQAPGLAAAALARAVSALQAQMATQIASANAAVQAIATETSNARAIEANALARAVRLREGITAHQQGLEGEIEGLNARLSRRTNLLLRRNHARAQTRRLRRQATADQEAAAQAVRLRVRAAAKAEAEQERLSAETAGLQSAVSKAERARHDRDRALLEKLRNLEAKKDAITAENNALENELLHVRSDTASALALVAELETRSAELEAQATSIREAEAKCERERLAHEAEHANIMAELTKNIHHCTGQRERYEASQTRSSEEARALKRNLKTLQSKAARANKIMTELAERATEAQTELREKNDALTQMVQKSVILESELEELESEHRAALGAEQKATKHAESRRAADEAARKKATRKQQLAAETQAKEDRNHTAAIKEATSMLDEIRRREATLKEDNASTEASTRSMLTERTALEAAYPDQHARIATTATEHAAALGEFRTQMISLRVDRERLALEAEMANRPLPGLRATLARAEAERDTALAAFDAACEEVNARAATRKTLETNRAAEEQIQATKEDKARATLEVLRAQEAAEDAEAFEWDARLAACRDRRNRVEVMQKNVVESTERERVELARVESKLLATTAALAMLRRKEQPDLEDERAAIWQRVDLTGAGGGAAAEAREAKFRAAFDRAAEYIQAGVTREVDAIGNTLALLHQYRDVTTFPLRPRV